MITPRRYTRFASGVTAAAAAWVIAQGISTLNAILPNYGPLDLAAMILLGLAVGGAVWGAAAHGAGRPLGREVLRGAASGAVAAGAATLLGLVAIEVIGPGSGRGQFLLGRFGTWGLGSAGLGLGLARPGLRRDAPAALKAAGWAGGVGLAGAVLMSAAGPTVIYHLVAWLSVGGAVGAFAMRDEM